LAAAAEKSGTDESVLTGRGTVRGRPVVVVANEFRFLGGSIGRAAAQRIAAAVRRATAERLPVLATTASGGTRMQEGTPAFLQMVEISRAVMAHRDAGLPYLVYLRHPTTGGVYASWGSLGHLTVAEPGALIGFLGPRVVEALTGTALPDGVQSAENLAAKGVIDGVVAPEHLPALVERALAVLVDPPAPSGLPRRRGEPSGTTSAWDSVLRTRAEGRVGVRDLLRYGASGTVRLSGTDEGERDESMLVALTRLGGQPCVVVGQDRTRQSAASPMGPAALRVARRALGLAGRGGGRAGGRDRAVHRGAHPHDGADAVRDPRAGLRRGCARAPARADRPRGRARVALAAAAGGCERHRARRHGARGRAGRG